MENSVLHKYFLNSSSKVLHKWFHYFDIYERHFERFRNKSPVMLEIGVSYGGSLEMWKEYFGPGCRIVGLDINPECKSAEAQGIEVYIGSQDDPAIINQILNKYPRIDIILDDGSHQAAHTRASFDLLYDHVNPNGVYMVEDTHAQYWPEYGGGLGEATSFVEFAKQKLDEINAVHTRGALPVTTFTKSTDSITAYDSVIVFERRRQGSRQAHMTGPMS